MEKNLLIAGRIVAGLLVLVAVIVLVFLLVGTTFVRAAATIPATVARALADEDFYSQAAQAAFTAVMDAVPENIKTVGAEIRKSDLFEAFKNAGLAAVSGEFVPREWLKQQIVTAITQARENASAGSQTEQVQASLRGEPGLVVAHLVVTAARECTDGEVQQLLDRLNGGDAERSIIGFICHPPTMPDVDLSAVMEDVVVVLLAEVANHVAENIPNPVDTFDLKNLGIETSVGTVTLEWPDLHLDTGSINVAYALPENIQQTVESAVTEMQAKVQAASDQIQARVAESREDLETLRSQITPFPSPTPLPTEAPVEETPPAIAATVTNALAEAQASITSSVEAALQTLDARLNELAASVNQTLLLVGGVALVLLTIEILFLVRTWRDVGIWLGVVLLASGIVTILLNGRIRANPVLVAPAETTLSETAQQLRTVLVTTVSSAVNSELTRPMLVYGVVLSLIGAALLVYLFVVSRRSTSTSKVSVPDNQDRPV